MMDAPLTDADAVASVPAGTPVRLEIDLATNAYRYVALDAQELKQRADDQAAEAVRQAADDAADLARDQLVAKLAAGKATEDEMQQAVARLLNRT